MSKTPDKRQRTDLDFFVLALIDGGVSTPYELQKEAGLSQGATNPALQRLLAARFVRQGKRHGELFLSPDTLPVESRARKENRFKTGRKCGRGFAGADGQPAAFNQRTPEAIDDPQLFLLFEVHQHVAA